MALISIGGLFRALVRVFFVIAVVLTFMRQKSTFPLTVSLLLITISEAVEICLMGKSAYSIFVYGGMGTYFPQFNVFVLLSTLLLLGAWIVATVLAFVAQKPDNKAKSFWFLPGACLLASPLVRAVGASGDMRVDLLTLGIRCALVAGVLSLVMSTIFFPRKKTAPHSPMYTQNGAVPPSSTPYAAAAPANDMYCGMTKHVLLLLFTCGIWLLIWVYRTTRNTNGIAGEADRDPTTKLLLFMFVPFYSIYWVYKTAQRIDIMAKQKGVPSDIATICLVLEIFVPIVPPIVMQDKMNEIVTARPPQVAPMQAMPVQAGASFIEQELAKYQEMVKSGVITSADYEKKKRQLMGLAPDPRTEEIQYYMGLMEQGVITKEDFEAKKKQILQL